MEYKIEKVAKFKEEDLKGYLCKFFDTEPQDLTLDFTPGFKVFKNPDTVDRFTAIIHKADFENNVYFYIGQKSIMFQEENELEFINSDITMEAVFEKDSFEFHINNEGLMYVIVHFETSCKFEVF